MNTTIPSLPARSHRPVTGVLLLATLTLLGVVLAPPSLRADTVIKDPSGQVLQFGRSTLKVNLHGANEQHSKHGETECLLMGMIKGRCVVAPRQSDSGTNFKFYWVDLLGNGHARFSGLDQDIIQTDGVPVTENSYLLSKRSHRYTALNQPNHVISGTNSIMTGQLLEWQDPCNTSVTNTTIFVCNGYGHSYLMKFNLVTDKSKGVTETKLKYLAGDNFFPTPSARKPLALDLVDVNRYSTSTDAPVHPVLAVWYNDGSRTNGVQYEGNQYLPNRVTFWTQDGSGNFNPTGITRSVPVGPESGTHFQTPNTATGGFLTATDGKGGLAYYFARNRNHYMVSGSVYNWDLYCDLYSMPIGISNSTVTVGDPVEFSHNECNYRRDGNSGDDQRNFQHVENPCWGIWNWRGPEVVFSGTPAVAVVKPSGFLVGTNMVGWNNKEPLAGVDTNDATNEEYQKKLRQFYPTIGYLTPVPTDSLNRANASLNILGGPESTNPYTSIDRWYTQQGTVVDQVFLGYPFLATPVDILGNYKDLENLTASFGTGTSTVTASNNAYSTGFSTEATAGVGVPEFPVTGGSCGAGVQGSYQNSQSSSTGGSTSIQVTTLVSAVVPEDYGTGFVNYVYSAPKIASWNFLCWSNNSGLQTNLSISGNTNYSYPLYSLVPSLEGGSFTQYFSRTNPALLARGGNASYDDISPDFDTNTTRSLTSPYAPLSAGLIQFPFSTLITYKETVATNQATNFSPLLDPIRKWQSSHNIAKDINFFITNHAGVTSLLSTNKQYQFTLENNIVLSNSKTTASSSSSESSYGIWGEVDWYVIASFSINWSSGTSRSVEETSGNSYTFTMPKSRNVAIHGNYYYYYVNIDVPALKSFMATHTYSLLGVSHTKEAVRPNWIPIWCWRNNQSFRLGFPWVK